MPGGNLISDNDLRRINKAVRWVERFGLSFIQRRRKRGDGGSSTLRRVKAQEAGQADGLLSVKFVDTTGAVTADDAFDVYAFSDQSATDMGNYLPAIAQNDIWSIKYIQGEWYLDWTPMLKGSKTSGHGANTVDIAGVVIDVGQVW